MFVSNWLLPDASHPPPTEEADVVQKWRPLQDGAGSLLQKLQLGTQMSLEFCRNWTRTW